MALIPEFDPIDTNYQQATGVFVATSKLGEVLEAQDVYITNSGFPVFDYNMVFVKRPDHELAASLEKAARYFEGRKLPYRVCVRADRADECRSLLLPRGFAEPQPFPGMQLSPIPEVPKAPAGLEIRRVCDAETLADFQKTAFEGFGLPIIEALACGAPVICSNTSSMKEIARDLIPTFDPFNISEMVHCMENVISKGWSNELRGRGMEYATTFDWRKTARSVMEVYRSVV